MTDDPSNRLNRLASLIDTIMYKDMMALTAELWRHRPQLMDTDSATRITGMVLAEIPPTLHAWAMSRQPELMEPPPPIQPLPPEPEELVEATKETIAAAQGMAAPVRDDRAPWKRGHEHEDASDYARRPSRRDDAVRVGAAGTEAGVGLQPYDPRNPGGWRDT